MDFDLSGAELGPWHLERLLGEGAMGKVYLAKHQRIGRVAAVKVLKAEHAKNPDLVQRFIAEATAVNAIRNEHIVEVYDFGEQPQPDGSALAYCVMELLEGRPLSEVMQQHFTIARTVRLGWQLAKALHSAHEIGVVHRDVKPENMFLHRKGDDVEFLKVLDFGVAKLLKPIGDLPQSGTAAGIVIGTPEYMAPEQALGAPTDRRADLYAVGLVLYELISGVQPFHADTFGKLVVEITSKPPPPLPDKTALGEVVHPTLKRIITRCLEKEPDRRFQTAEELAHALEPFVTGAPVRELAPTPMPRMPALLPSPNEADDALVVQRSKAPVVVAASVVLALLGAGVLLFMPPMERAAPPSPVVVPPSLPEVTAVVPPGPARVWLEVSSTPPGAEVVRADSMVLLGVTPFRIELETAASVPLAFALDEHQPLTREVSLKANATVSVDLVPTVKQDAPTAKPKGPGGKKPVSRDGVLDPFSQ
ncbi:MAG: serine/threonine protein kinase [Myxococcaceae bacterium]|nr:serine/threonine protein kinase [Myxococcaceae bacterium]